MTDAQKEYIEYLLRVARTSCICITKLHEYKLSQEVGRSFGLTDLEMKQAVDECGKAW